MKLSLEQKLKAMSHRFYGGATWEPKAGDLYTTSRDDLELYRVVEVNAGLIKTEYTDNPGVIATWARQGFLTEGFGPQRVWVPDFIIEPGELKKQTLEFGRRVNEEGEPHTHGDYISFDVDGITRHTSALQVQDFARSVFRAFDL